MRWSHGDGKVAGVGNRVGNRGCNVTRGCGGCGARGRNRPPLGRQMLSRRCETLGMLDMHNDALECFFYILCLVDTRNYCKSH